MTFSEDGLITLASRILTAAGSKPADAACVAADLARSNLLGHDSHGVMRLVQYVGFIREGHVDVAAEPEVLVDRPAVCVVDGKSAFGQVVSRFALERAAEKASAAGAATVLVRNCNHVGRLGGVTEEAAKRGFAAVMVANAPGPGQVAPLGARERRMGTNPISVAAPARLGDDAPPLVLDMTTSATAEGKLRVARQKGESVPEGQIIDRRGNPSTDPEDFYEDDAGSILPLGGPLAHKGYGLAVAADLLAGVLSGAGVGRTDLPRGANGVYLSLTDIRAVMDESEYDRWLAAYESHIRGAAPIREGETIRLPGDVERERAAERAAGGIPLPAETWRQIRELAGELGVDVSDIGAGV